MNNTDADQPAHPCSLISAFIIRFLESGVLAVMADSLEECIARLKVWKEGMECKGLSQHEELQQSHQS